MSRERWIRAVAGSLVLISIGLGWSMSPIWLLLGAFVGANLLQSAFTGFCPLERVLEHAGIGSNAASPVDTRATRM